MPSANNSIESRDSASADAESDGGLSSSSTPVIPGAGTAGGPSASSAKVLFGKPSDPLNLNVLPNFKKRARPSCVAGGEEVPQTFYRR